MLYSFTAVKIEHVVEILDSGDESVNIQPEKHEKEIIQNDTTTNKITLTNQNSKQRDGDVDMHQDDLLHLSTPSTVNANNDVGSAQCSNTSSLDSNIKSFLNDHQYAKLQVDECQADAKANDNSTDDLTKDITENGEAEFTQSPEAVDITSDKERLTSTVAIVDDEQVQPAIQRKNAYNTRNAGNFKAGRWQKLTNNSTMVCKDMHCGFCHENSNERPHECTHCSKRFIRKQDLKRHNNIHVNQFRCSICGVGLPDAKSCESHKYHCKYTRFECYLCKKYFSEVGKMSKHLCNMHIGKRQSARPTQFQSKFRIVLNELPI